jgi:TPR repeat protein
VTDRPAKTEDLEKLVREAEASGPAALVELGRALFVGEGREADRELALELWRRAAAAGEPRASFNLFEVYSKGRGAPGDEQKALGHLQEALAGHLPEAFERLGAAHYFGLYGFDRDYALAAESWRKGADGGDGRSLHNLACLHFEGLGAERNPGLAVALWTEAVEKGCLDSLPRLATAYDEGRGVEKDRKKAEGLWRLGADEGEAECLFRLGRIYQSGEVVSEFLSQDRAAYPQLAAECYQKAALKGLPEGQHALGRAYLCGFGLQADFQEARRWFLAASRNGSEESALALAAFEADPASPSGRTDLDRTLAFWRQAAADGSPFAAFNLAMVHLNEAVPSLDRRDAVGWLEMAVQKGLPEAEFKMGVLLLKGGLVEKNQVEGLRLLAKSAEDGCLEAMLHLADLYANGRVVAQDSAKAGAYLKQAADLGDGEAQLRYGLLRLKEPETSGTSGTSGTSKTPETSEAEKYLRLAADQQILEAKFNLALFLWDRKRVDDEAEAVGLLTEAAERGMIKAAATLGLIRYAGGQGFPGNKAKGLALLAEAAQQNSPEAQHYLGLLLARDRPPLPEGFEGDAVFWLTKAAENGRAEAAALLAELLSRESFAEANCPPKAAISKEAPFPPGGEKTWSADGVGAAPARGKIRLVPPPAEAVRAVEAASSEEAARAETLADQKVSADISLAARDGDPEDGTSQGAKKPRKRTAKTDGRSASKPDKTR